MLDLAQESPLRLALERAPAAIALVDRDMRYLHVNRRFRTDYNLGDAELVGRSHYEVFPDVTENWRSMHERCLLGAVESSKEDPCVRQDGTTEWLRWEVRPWRDGQGEIGGLLMITEVITEQKLAEQALRASVEVARSAKTEAEAARRDAETANRMKDEFLALLGHELRNPLAPILTALQLMKIRGDDTASRERTIIERQVHHLVSLVDDLLDVSRITRGKVDLKKRAIEASEVVTTAIEMASPLFEQRSHNLRIAVARRGLMIEVDELRMAQAIANLLTNAARYTDVGGEIAISADAEGNDVVIRVTDTGSGIAPEMLPRVFDMFVQGQRTVDRAQGGLGLGLTIVRSFVELHGGQVTAMSAGLGRGAEFAVRLPAFTTPVQAPPPDTARARSADGATDGEGRGKRVLVVDDNVDAAETLADVLTAFGYVTRVAHDGPAALAEASAFAPEIALLDIGLPVMDGYELARRLRDLAGDARLRLVAVTGYGQQSDRDRSLEAGFHEHLVKPIKLDQLREILEHAEEPAS